MIARPIRPEEKIEASKLQSIAFLLGRDFSQSANNPDQAREGYESTRAIFSKEGKMCACLELLPYKATFDGHIVDLAGLGGVATLPEERGKAYMPRLISKSIGEMAESGYIFSYLYPFSHSYYRRFGYELNMTSRRLKIPLYSMSHFKKEGTISLLRKGVDEDIVKGVYEEFIRDLNLAIVRDESSWQSFFAKDPYKDNIFIYLLHDDKAKTRAYIKFEAIKTSQYSHDMQVIEFVWLDNKALTGMFAFIFDHTSQFENFIWDCPMYLDILSLFPEPYDIKQQIIPNGMNRIINLKGALGLMRPAKGKGQFVLEARDELLDKNSARYSIRWDYPIIEVEQTIKEPDIRLDIKDLSQLVTGYQTVRALIEAGKVELSGKIDQVDSLFTYKKLYINDKF